MKILVCDNLEEKVIEKLSELGEVTNISDYLSFNFSNASS